MADDFLSLSAAMSAVAHLYPRPPWPRPWSTRARDSWGRWARPPDDVTVMRSTADAVVGGDELGRVVWVIGLAGGGR